MGCDIHWVIEKKTPEGWLGVACSKYSNARATTRWYPFFAELGLEGRDEARLPEKIVGLPSDMSELATHHYKRWESDAHTASHVSLQTFVCAWRRAEARFPAVVVTDSQELVGFPFWIEANETKFRVVFWFDN